MNNINKVFIFNDENLKEATVILAKYPIERKNSALIPLLTLAQEQNAGWLSRECIEYIADFLDLHVMKVLEVASFYTMFNLKPVGKYHIQICTTTPCWLRGSSEIKQICESRLNIKCGEKTEDAKFSIVEVECLGACVNSPVVQINNDYYENLTTKSMIQVIDEIAEKEES